MTTPWKPAGEWAGLTVAVLASGPSMTAAVAEALREHKTIAVNYTHRLAPWADMLVGLDANWPKEMREFEGMRVTGIEDPEFDALYIGPQWERVRMAAGREIEVHNSGLAAVRIAARMGAARIILAGFEPSTHRRFFTEEWSEQSPADPYPGVAEGLEQIVAQLRAAGVAVEFYEEPKPARVGIKRG